MKRIKRLTALMLCSCSLPFLGGREEPEEAMTELPAVEEACEGEEEAVAMPAVGY